MPLSLLRLGTLTPYPVSFLFSTLAPRLPVYLAGNVITGPFCPLPPSLSVSLSASSSPLNRLFGGHRLSLFQLISAATIAIPNNGRSLECVLHANNFLWMVHRLSCARVVLRSNELIFLNVSVRCAWDLITLTRICAPILYYKLSASRPTNREYFLNEFNQKMCSAIIQFSIKSKISVQSSV